MPTITIFLLFLIGTLIPANALLWLTEKRNNQTRPNNKTIFLKNPGNDSPKASEIQTIQQQATRLENYIRKNNGFLQDISKLKSQNESIYPKIQALKETTIQIQNELKKMKAPRSTETLSTKKEQLPKTNRVKILEEYLKKTS